MQNVTAQFVPNDTSYEECNVTQRLAEPIGNNADNADNADMPTLAGDVADLLEDGTARAQDKGCAQKRKKGATPPHMGFDEPQTVLEEAFEAAKEDIPNDALVPEDMFEELKTFKPHNLPPPPTLVMPTYTEEQMPWPARKYIKIVVDGKHIRTNCIPIKPNWRSYEEYLESMRKLSYMTLYNNHLPLYKQNVLHKNITPSACHALQTVLNEKYARHLQLCILFENQSRLL